MFESFALPDITDSGATCLLGLVRNREDGPPGNIIFARNLGAFAYGEGRFTEYAKACQASHISHLYTDYIKKREGEWIF